MLNDTTDASISSGGQSTITFDLANWSSSASPGLARIGMPFKQGDIPSGSTPDVRVNGASVSGIQFDERTAWPDGSLRFCVGHLRDSTFAGNQSRSYTAAGVVGAYNNTGIKTLADITGAHDFKVMFTGVTDYTGASYGSGNFTASFNAQAAIPTRVNKIHSGPVCEGWVVWGFATDNVSGTPDAHLVTEWYVDIWKNADGSTASIEFGAVPSLYWWSVAGKKLLNYTASIKDGSTAIQNYGAIKHPYRSQWLTAKLDNDNNYCRRHQTGTAPTLSYKPNRPYWMSTYLVPPFNLSIASTKHYNPVYVPCQGMDHAVLVDATGGSMGRGLLPNSDCVAFTSQTAADARAMRTEALAGLGITFHYRSNRTRTRPGDGGASDIAATIISLKVDPIAPASYNFTAQGMPIPVDAYSTILTDGYVAPLGGSGVWVAAGGASHAANYSYFTYLLEGERYFMQALLDYTISNQIMGQANANGTITPIAYYAGRHSLIPSMPSTTYHAVANLWGDDVRKVGWYLNILGSACAVVPDNDPQAGAIRVLNTQAGNFLHDSLAYIPASQVANGCWGDVNGQGEPWMISFIVQGAYTNYLRTGNARVKELGDHCTKHLMSLANYGMYRMMAYHTSPLFKTAEWAPGSNEYHPIATMPIGNQTACVKPADRLSPTVKLSVAGGFDAPGYIYKSFNPAFLTLRNGDVIRPVTINTKGGAADYMPRGLTHGEKLYAINVGAMPNPTNNTGQTFNLSRDGVTPVDPDLAHGLNFSAVLATGDIFSCSLTDGVTTRTVGPVAVASTADVASALGAVLALFGAGSYVASIAPETTFHTVRWYPPSGQHISMTAAQINRGGSMTAVTAADYMHAYFSWFPQSAADYDAGGVAVLPPYTFDAGDYGSICRAGMVMARIAGNSSVSAADITRINAFIDTNERAKGAGLTWQFTP